MRNNWTREELLMALNLYCKIPYGQFNTHSKDVQEFAKLIGRTPGAVGYKLVNFVSLDPRQQKLGRKGATNTGKLDKIVFKEFMENFDECLLESERIIESRTGVKSEILHENEGSKQIEILENMIDPSKRGTTKPRIVMTRVNQNYFRKIVLANYTSQCPFTGINVPELLIASHINRWSDDVKNRLNPMNGICLSALIDKAFDTGLITIDKSFRIVFSQQLKKYIKEEYYDAEIGRFENAQMTLPIKFLPCEECLKFHYDNVFLG